MAAPAANPGRYRVPGKPLNLTSVFLDRHVEAGHGDRPALFIDRPDSAPRTVSYGELQGLSDRFGHLLRGAGVEMEHRVLIILEDGWEWAASFFGALKIGATTAFVNPEVSDAELAFYLEDSRARAVVTHGRVADRLPEGHRAALVIVDTPDFEAQLEAQPEGLEAAPTLEDDFAIWLFTSGSTGAPKAAVHRGRDFVFNTERYAKDVLQMAE
ncbi:MAG: AMP-binding protein, partial [Myxococcota bacterium]